MTADADAWIAAMEADAQPCAALRHAGAAAGGGPAGRLGGLPTIAGSHQWPDANGRPLAFVGEIDLALVAEVYRPGWLPESGRLHFFYDMVEWRAGYDPADRGHFAVLHSPAAVPPREAPAPAGLAADVIFPLVGLAAVAAASHPDPLLLEERLGRLFDLPDQEWRRIEDFRAANEHRPLHQVGGHASPIQGPDLGLECQLASNGIYIGGPEGYARPEVAALAPGAVDWRLLLQVDSDERAGMMWGDVGMLYFLIREQDAKRADFSRAWLLMQCS